MAEHPTAPRIVAGIGAVGALYLFVLSQPFAFHQQGCSWTALALAVAALPLVAFLGLLAVDPARLQAMLASWTRLDLRDSGHVAAAVVMAATLFFVLGWGTLVSAAATLEGIYGACGLAGAVEPTGEAVLTAVTINFAIFTLPVLLYLAVVPGGGPRAALARLGLHAEGAGRAVVIGLLVALGFLVALVVASAAISPFVPEEALQNDQALAIARGLTWLGALGLALGSGIGEEIFFRGFLQQRIGILATSVVFAIAHTSYQSITEVVVVFVLSLALGYLFKRTGHLGAPIATHFLFNFLQLLAAIYAAEYLAAS